MQSLNESSNTETDHHDQDFPPRATARATTQDTRVRFRDDDHILHQSLPDIAFASSDHLQVEEDPNHQSNYSLLTVTETVAETAATPPSPISSPQRSIMSKTKKHQATTAAHRPSVFERLSQMETVASLHQKFLPAETTATANTTATTTERKMKRSTSAPPSLRNKTNNHNSKSNDNNFTIIDKYKKDESKMDKSNMKKSNSKVLPTKQFFERLAGNHTALSQSRQRQRSKRSSSLGRRHSIGRRRTSTGIDNINQNHKRFTRKTRAQIVKESLRDAFDTASLGPPLEIEFSSQMMITCSYKFVPELGLEKLNLFDLGLNSYLSEYEAGSISASEFASEIMNALLWRDLPSNVKWDVKSPLERELAMPIGEIGYSFIIEASGKLMDDGHDGNSGNDEKTYTASATGNVTFLPDWEIQVENFSCVHDFE